jgi:DNA-binding MarR family transcriptional regulator
MHWTDALHQHLIAISDLVNRVDVDLRLLADSGVKLDRALFPLLSRIDLHPDIIPTELANLVGRDHSTVSRQVAKLVELGLVTRRQNDTDGRVQHLLPSEAGKALVAQVRTKRRAWMERHFASWSAPDRDRLLTLMAAMLAPESSQGSDKLAGKGSRSTTGYGDTKQ